eukprot:3295842-Pyramimonas_sp.AAC.1
MTAPAGCRCDVAGGIDQMQAGRALDLGVVREVISEPSGGAHRDPNATYMSVRAAIIRHLKELQVR